MEGVVTAKREKKKRKNRGLVEWENMKKGQMESQTKNMKKRGNALLSWCVCLFGDRLDLEVVKGERVEDEQLTSGDRRAVKKRGRKWEGRIK